jgi:hypothetical protein
MTSPRSARRVGMPFTCGFVEYEKCFEVPLTFKGK